MKCEARIFRDGRGTVIRSFSPAFMVRNNLSLDSPSRLPKHYNCETIRGFKKCSGNIIAKITAFDEQGYSTDPCGNEDHFAALRIEYKCDKCGCQDFSELPGETEISTFMTKLIATITKTERKKLLTPFKGKGW